MAVLVRITLTALRRQQNGNAGFTSAARMSVNGSTPVLLHWNTIRPSRSPLGQPMMCRMGAKEESMICDKALLARCTRAPFWYWSRLPRIPAVYLVLAETADVLYVGAARDLWARWTGGHHHFIDFRTHRVVCIAWFTPPEDIFVAERILIAQLQPPLNGRHPRIWKEVG
jgi:hypothetical protein